jgi:hypothetical protein
MVGRTINCALQYIDLRRKTSSVTGVNSGLSFGEAV